MPNLSRRHFLRTGGVALGAAAGSALIDTQSAQALPNFDVVAWKNFTTPTTNFTVQSSSLVLSNLPVNPTFIKQQSNTWLWVVCAIGIVPTAYNSAFTAVVLDNTQTLFAVPIAGLANQLITVNFTTLFAPIPAGSH